MIEILRSKICRSINDAKDDLNDKIMENPLVLDKIINIDIVRHDIYKYEAVLFYKNTISYKIVV